MTLEVRLPKPHPKQADIEQSGAKRKVIVTGRRFGKTTMAARAATKAVLNGRRVLYVAPKEAQTEAFWSYCKKFLAPLGRYLYKNETLHQIKVGDGVVRAKTGFDADTLRGDYADLLILDEFSYMDPDVWDLVGAPMLLDNDGDAIFICTPARKNHAYRMFQRALGDETGRWRAWHAKTYDNPHLSSAALAELTADMSEDARRQEIEAEFLENEGQVFRNINACLYNPTDEQIRKHKKHHLVAGMDWGRHHDATVLSIGCADCREEIVLDRFTQIGYPIQRDRIKQHVERWHPSLLAEGNSIGGPNIEQLREDGVSVSAFETTHASKSRIIRRMQLAFDGREWKWLDRPVANGELEAFEMKVTQQGNVTYGAPDGMHDDTVMARAIMLENATSAPLPFAIVGGEDED